MANAVQTTGQKAQNLYFLQRIVAESNKRLHKNATGLMADTVNPLWNINERQAQLIYDYARTGNYAQIQYLYNEIEERDPTLLVCVTRRTSAVAELDWRVVRSDERLNRNADKALIDEQIECVETAMAKIDNMPDALEHLALSAFRGFSVVAPIHDVSGDIKHLDLVDSWNLCFDRLGQSWYFNPTASSFAMPTTVIGQNAFKGLQYIPHDHICAVTRKREIDWPAMQIFLRAAVGERDWGRFLETYGLPPVIITMPEFTNKEEQEAYIQAAADVFEGRSGVVPYGSNVNYASESRGTNPFTEFIEHQQKLVVMMATGGTLATLAESGTGTLAGDAQQDEWKRIIRADKRIISNAINKQICENIIRNCKDFKDKPILAEFQLDDTPKPTPKEMLELAGAAASAGFEMDVDELSQACGFTLRKKVEGGDGGFGGLPPLGGGGNGGGDTPSVTIPDQPDNQGDQPKPEEDPNGGLKDGQTTSTATVPDGETVTNVDEGAPKTPNAAVKTPIPPSTSVSTPDPIKDTPAALKASTPVSEGAMKAGEDLVRSLQTDFKPVADRIAEILTLPDAEKAGAAMKLLQEIDSLIPDDPAMAEVIAEEMKTAFSSQLAKQPTGDAPAANKVVPNAKKVIVCNIFGDNPCPKCGSEMTKAGACHNEDCEDYSEDSQDDTEDEKKSEKIKPLEERCQDALNEYNKSTDHPSADEVAYGAIDIREALKKGFSATIGGCHLTFYTQSILGNHYEGREYRLDAIPDAIANRNKLIKRGSVDGKVLFYPDRPTADGGNKHIVIADVSTGMVISVIVADDDYIQRRFKRWRKSR